MDKNQNYENFKTLMKDDVILIMHHLHYGERSLSDLCLEDLKAQSVHFGEKIQQDVLNFAEQVEFQFDYDPWHKITPEVQMAADQLLKDLE